MSDANNATTEEVGKYLLKKLSPGDFEELLSRTARNKLSELQSGLQAIQSEMGRLQSEREELSFALRQVVKAGAAETSLPEITEPLAKVTRDYEKAARKERHLIDDIARHSPEVSESERVAVKAAEEAFDSVMLKDFGTAEPTLAELREVLRLMSVASYFNSDKSVSVEFDNSDEALSDVVRYLAMTAMKKAENEEEAMRMILNTRNVNTH